MFTPRLQSCCGSLHAHNGELDLAREMARRNILAVEKSAGSLARVDAIISNAGGCGSHLKNYKHLLHDDPVFAARAEIWSRKLKDIHEWLVEIGLQRPDCPAQNPEMRESYELMQVAFKNLFVASALGLALVGVPITTIGADAPKPLRLLLITGGCCHDYTNQKDVLKKGLEARANVVVDQIHSADTSTKPRLAIYGTPDYAAGYDLVIHDECAADISEQAVVEGILKPHRDGIPGVNLHCAVHSYRIGNPNDPVVPGTPHGLWFEYLGLQSSGHGPQLPIAIHFTDRNSPLVKDLGDWTTINEELYNNVRVFASARPIAHGQQVTKQKDGTPNTNDCVVAWTNEYGPKKTRVFSTTIGHNTQTVADPRYLDLVTRGVLWATGQLNEDGTPTRGYGSIGAKPDQKNP